MDAGQVLKSVWPQWELVREIGSGSFGQVYEIGRQDVGGQYKAALKFIRIPQSDSEMREIMSEGMDEKSATQYFQGIMEDLVREFSMMEKLKGNTNIVSYEDHAVVPHPDGKGWDILIRMELLTPLSQYMENHPMTETDVRRLGMDMCRALDLCGKYHIIHRDIKPENIFVSELGDFKLGDFGIARTAEKTMSAMSRKGTYTYMAPEVYKGEAYNASVDQYSLGIVLYRLLNDYRAPFMPSYPNPISYTDREEAQSRRMRGEPFPNPAHASAQMSALIRKACAFYPQDRFASAADMGAALEQLGSAGGDTVSGGNAVPGSGSAYDNTSADATYKMNVGNGSFQNYGGLNESRTNSFDTSGQGAAGQQGTAAFQGMAPGQQGTGDTSGPKKPKKGLMIGLIAGAAVVVIVIAVAAGALLGGGGSTSVADGSGSQGQVSGNEGSVNDSSALDEGAAGDDGSGVSESAAGDGADSGAGVVLDENILPTKMLVDEATGYGIVPEGSGAAPHDNSAYPPESLYGYWVLEGYTSSSDEIHPTDSTMTLMDGDQEIILESFPYSLDFGSDFYLYDTLEEYHNVYGGMDFGQFSFYYPGDNNGLVWNGIYDTSGDTLAIGLLQQGTGSELEFKEMDYQISWTGYKLTLTRDGESVVYVPLDVVTNPDNGYNTVAPFGSVFKEYQPVDNIVYISNLSEGTLRYKDSEYGATVDAQYDFREDGTVTISTAEGKTYDLNYRYAGDTITLFSDTEFAVYNTNVDWYTTSLSDSVDADTLDSMSDDEKQVLAQEHQTVLERLKEAFAAAGLDVNIDEVTGQVTMDASILFAFDDATLSDEGKAFLDTFLNAYASVILSDECSGYVSQIVIEGHSDTNGEYDYNLVLSKDRADAVVNYCLSESNSGLSPEQIQALSQMMTAVGRSYDEPVYKDTGEVDMDASRRVVFKFMMNTNTQG